MFVVGVTTIDDEEQEQEEEEEGEQLRGEGDRGMQ